MSGRWVTSGAVWYNAPDCLNGESLAPDVAFGDERTPHIISADVEKGGCHQREVVAGNCSHELRNVEVGTLEGVEAVGWGYNR